ncbi:MAG: hypothetical protein PHO37_03775 [Kiritimatiellae bacterium]|nr:hypothetical protein [Kiritimatiellia bacterium]
MKQTQGQWLVFGALALWCVVAEAGFPMPPTITYGLIRNEYGQPLLSGAQVSLVRVAEPGTICAQHNVNGLILSGVNYRLSLELESTAPLSRPNAALVGTPMQIIVTINGVVQPLTPTPYFNAPDAGTARRVDFATAVDSDGDGLPDAWEELVVIWSEGVFTSIHDINPLDDPDNDGMNNRDEYLAGTLPFLKTDIFAITALATEPASDRLALTFSTSEDRTYHIMVSESLDSPTWSPAPSAATKGGDISYRTYQGTGRTATVYVEKTSGQAFYRIGAN